MKACQFKIYKCFDKEREQTLIQQSIRKEKLTLFYNRLFYKAL